MTDDKATLAQLTDIINAKDQEIVKLNLATATARSEHRLALKTLDGQRDEAQKAQETLAVTNRKLRVDLAASNKAALLRIQKDDIALKTQNQEILKLKERCGQYTQAVVTIERLQKEVAEKERARLALSTNLSSSSTSYELALKAKQEEYSSAKQEAQQRFDKDRASYISQKTNEVQKCMTKGNELDTRLVAAKQLLATLCGQPG